MSIIWDFIQNQLLGMKWLNELIGRGLSALGLDITGRIGSSVQFFLYDVIKITVQMCIRDRFMRVSRLRIFARSARHQKKSLLSR